MQITTTVLFLSAAIGVIATPIQPERTSVDVRDNASSRIEYTGKCTRSTNICRYEGQNNKIILISCPSAANLRCTNDGRACSYESSTKKVTCG
ncbi:antifungal protein [Phaeosphaeriaceae sp. PMI808]|nr:antifungal protein [Phaeosphaeriaceae sp. PMI808]